MLNDLLKWVDTVGLTGPLTTVWVEFSAGMVAEQCGSAILKSEIYEFAVIS